MRCAIFVLTSAAVAVAYSDPASFALLAGLLGFYRLCDWVRATRHQSRWHWRAERVRCSLADRDGPGGWAEPVLLTVAPKGGS